MPNTIQMTVFLSAALCAFSTQADEIYTFSSQSGINGTDSMTTAALSNICKGSTCYVLPVKVSPEMEMMEKYQLQSFSFSQLAAVTGVKQSENRLILPEELGQTLFDIGQQASLEESSTKQQSYAPGKRKLIKLGIYENP